MLRVFGLVTPLFLKSLFFCLACILHQSANSSYLCALPTLNMSPTYHSVRSQINQISAHQTQVTLRPSGFAYTSVPHNQNNKKKEKGERSHAVVKKKGFSKTNHTVLCVAKYHHVNRQAPSIKCRGFWDLMKPSMLVG